MSKRYGRNQRRAHRERIAELERIRKEDLAEAARNADKLYKSLKAADARARLYSYQLDQVCDQLTSALGRETAFLPADRAPQAGNMSGVNYWPAPIFGAPSPSADVVPLDITTFTVAMRELRLSLVEDPYSLRRQIRVLLVRPHGSPDSGEVICGAAIGLSVDHVRRAGVSDAEVDLLFKHNRDALRDFIRGMWPDEIARKETRHG